MARPEFQPTAAQRKTVEMLAAVGTPHQDMLCMITDKDGKPISLNTLKKHFEVELQVGRVKANAKIAETLYRKAAAGDTASMIFWLKTRAGWSEKTQIEHTGKDGGPIAVKEQRDLTSNELKEELAKRGLPTDILEE